MPRAYNVTFKGVAVSGAQDLVQLLGGAGKMARILRAWCGVTDSTVPATQSLQFECLLMTATVTTGSGGGASTPHVVDPGDAAATVAGMINNTVLATTSGSSIPTDEQGQYILNGYDNMFAKPPVMGPTSGFVFRLVNAPTGTIHLSGGVLFEEFG